MHKARRAAIVGIALVLVAGVLIYSERRSGSAATIVGVVRATEVRRAMSWRGSPRWN
jgi:HlyD family secretion protein